MTFDLVCIATASPQDYGLIFEKSHSESTFPMSKSTGGLQLPYCAVFQFSTDHHHYHHHQQQQQMSGRGSSSRIAIPDAKDRVFAAGDAVADAKLARARAREALSRAEEAVWRAVYRHNVERAALEALERGLGGWGWNGGN